MCGIVGYIGKQNGIDVVLSGLQSLEYRGYDSAGVAFLDAKKQPHVVKQVGQVANLRAALGPNKKVASLAIGHTRWATHGSPTIKNAHPHFNTSKTIYVVHNGIIENNAELRAKLEAAGYHFVSQTDTEVIPQLIDYHYQQTHNFGEAFELALRELQGAYAIAAISSYEPDMLYVARLSSPLVVGVGEGEYLIASDPTAIMDYTHRVIYLEDYEMVTISPTGYAIKNFRQDKKIQRDAETLTIDSGDATLGSYPNFMLKEMHEVPDTLRAAIRGRVQLASTSVKLGGLESVTTQLKGVERIVIVACGTSYYAGLVGEYLIEELAGIPVEVQYASEFKYRTEPMTRSTAVLALSQSGETADTIAALKKVEDYGVLRLGVVNAVGSTIARITDAGVYLHAGPEQAVASTKAFVAQVTVLTLIALKLSNNNTKLFKPVLNELAALPEKAAAILKQAPKIQALAKKYAHHRDFLYIGRRYAFPCALEGALKLKEVSYIHAEGYAAGEMKHGPLAMIDENFPTFAIACNSPLLEKTYSNIEEIKARGGHVLAVATEGNKDIKQLTEDVIYIPDTLEHTQPQLVALAEQLFAYYVAIERGYNVDRPRNLAKSVTVE
ncbi:MAG TPA: glutamine--fructose-6-phosphate transaminase (isomerizing) [Candidatus Saccharimonadales bacterium]|jgi:glucosamine--fructose-6-phosphate aminotransferase (isomerizing)|nr:glutamine--fructose-6-phosphate transaminase (isomerizing) [Candidatus Saccharimonadales bacterium]